MHKLLLILLLLPTFLFAQFSGTIIDTACSEYVWDGVIYNTSGTYTNIFTDINGYDSTVNLTLTILEDSSVTYITACDSAEWNGVWYYNDTTVTTTGLITSNSFIGAPNSSGSCLLDIVIMVDMTGSTGGPTDPAWVPGSISTGTVYSAETMFVWEFIQAMSAGMIAGYTQIGVMLWSDPFGGIPVTSCQTPGANASGSQLWLSNDPSATGWHTNMSNNWQDGATPMNFAFDQGVNFLDGAVLNDINGNPRSSLGDRTLDPAYRRIYIFVTDGCDNGTPIVSSSIFTPTGVNGKGCPQQGTAPSPPGSAANNAGQATVISRVIGVFASVLGNDPSCPEGTPWYNDLESIICVPAGGYPVSPNIFNVGTIDGVPNPPDIVANDIALMNALNSCSSSGCDSVATAIITINSGTSSIDSITVCHSYSWNGSTFSTSDSYTYTATNLNGCDSMANLVLNVIGANLFLPNTFTPNNDNKNEQFAVYENGLQDYQIWIFNRWGEQIFYSNNSEQGWDGKYENRISQDGVYVWRIIYSCQNVFEERVGIVTLLR